MNKTTITENKSMYSKENYRKKLFKEFDIFAKESSLTEEDWYRISYRQVLSEEFIREFEHSVNWPQISYYQEISEDFICEFQDKVDWSHISFRQSLSEDFMKKFSHKINWNKISSKQIMFNDFILENSDKIDFNIYFVYQQANFEIMKKFILKSTHKYVQYFKLEHLTKEQKQEIQRILDLKYLFTK